MVACGSLEMGADTPQDARRIAELLPAGTPVYVNHMPKRPLESTLAALVALREANLEPVPHIAARRVGSPEEAQAFLAKARRLAGVSKVLLLGGDVPEPARALCRCGGPSARGFLRGERAEAGRHRRLSRRGIRASPPTTLNAALADKLALARAQGLEPHIVTQFSFAPNRIAEYCADLTRRAPGVPVYVGLAGPTSPVQLLKFAQRCGVSASLRALQAEGMRAVKLFTHVDPSDQLMALAQHIRSGSASNVVGVHLYSFGGVARTAAWMNERIRQRA